MLNNEIVIDGIVYLKAYKNPCDGCVADNDETLCKKLPDCDQGTIFKLKQKDE